MSLIETQLSRFVFEFPFKFVKNKAFSFASDAQCSQQQYFVKAYKVAS